MTILIAQTTLLFTLFIAILVLGQKTRKLFIVSELLLFQRYDVVYVDLEFFEVVEEGFLLLDEEADLIGVFLDFGLAVLLNAVGDRNFYLVIFEHMGGGRPLKALETLDDCAFWSKEDLNFWSAGKILLLTDPFQIDVQKVSALLHKIFFLVAVELLSRHWWYIQSRIPRKKHLVK
jgi:hypothetical protein